MHKIDIGTLHCLCYGYVGNKEKIAYILYPVNNILDNWIQPTAKKYKTTIVVITGMDWQNVFSPWPAKGVPAGSPDFKGESSEFLQTLRQKVIPKVESILGINNPERSLIGVSMSGLFALWQWIMCDSFKNIASLSGSFWYEGFMEWISSKTYIYKNGSAFFLLGTQEIKTRIKAFNSIEANTSKIVEQLKMNGIKVRFDHVPGNHFSNPIPRLEAAFSALYTLRESSQSDS